MTGKWKEKSDSFSPIAQDYVEMIDWEGRLKREGPFFLELFKAHDVHSVLDLACGPGRQAVLFSSFGFISWGCDESSEMIKIAREYAKYKGEKTKFILAPFGKLLKKIKRKFDAVICIGNSLPQVSNQGELESLIKEISALLYKDGIFFSQSRNYDNLSKGKLVVMPVDARKISDKEILFLRMWEREGEKIKFRMLKFFKEYGKWKNEVRESLLYSVTQRSLAKALEKAGFRRAQWFGGYDRSSFNPKKSTDLVVLARR